MPKILFGILIAVIVIAALVVIDFIQAVIRTEWPFSLFFYFLITSAVNSLLNLKRMVRVDRSVSGEELLALSAKKNPLYKRAKNSNVKIYNDTYDTFYLYKEFHMESRGTEGGMHRVILPRPKYYHLKDEPKFDEVYVMKHFEFEKVDASQAVQYTVGPVSVSEVAAEPTTIYGRVIYNDLNQEVTLRYLGDHYKRTFDEPFVMKPGEVVVIEWLSVVCRCA